jgi:hypothetical protein
MTDVGIERQRKRVGEYEWECNEDPTKYGTTHRAEASLCAMGWLAGQI